MGLSDTVSTFILIIIVLFTLPFFFYVFKHTKFNITLNEKRVVVVTDDNLSNVLISRRLPLEGYFDCIVVAKPLLGVEVKKLKSLPIKTFVFANAFDNFNLSSAYSYFGIIYYGSKNESEVVFVDKKFPYNDIVYELLCPKKEHGFCVVGNLYFIPYRFKPEFLKELKRLC